MPFSRNYLMNPLYGLEINDIESVEFILNITVRESNLGKSIVWENAEKLCIDELSLSGRIRIIISGMSYLATLKNQHDLALILKEISKHCTLGVDKHNVYYCFIPK